MNILIAVLIFGVIIIIHELGHFWAARACGITVEEFAVGIGPKIIGVKRGETLFSLRLIPFGGFCKMLGGELAEPEKANKKSDKRDEIISPEENIQSQVLNERSFPAKPVWKRLIVISSGIVMNVLLAFLILFAMYSATFFRDSTIYSVAPGFPAEAAGLLSGDRITGINGNRTPTFIDSRIALDRAIEQAPGSPIEVEILRGGRRHTLHITPRFDEEAGVYRLGFNYALKIGMFSNQEIIPGSMRAGFAGTVRMAALTCARYANLIFETIGMLITREASVDDLAGPIGLVNFISEAYQQSMTISPWVAFWDMMSLTALLSVNLAIFNFLPLPALDGGRIIFLLVEAVRRKPVSPEKEGLIHFAGFVLLMILAVFVAYNDVLRII